MDRMDRTLAHLKRVILPDGSTFTSSTQAPNFPLINSLLGIQEPRWLPMIPPAILMDTRSKSEKSASESDVRWFGDNLNDSQKEAIRFCLKAEHIACIHGPPGVITFLSIEVYHLMISRPAKPIP